MKRARGLRALQTEGCALGCRTADFLINRRRQEAGAPPFIGLIPLDEAARERAIERTRQFLDGRPDRLNALFRQFPSLAAWLVTHSLSERYGDAGHAVYPHIADTLGVVLDNQQHRKVLVNLFLGVCDRFGLLTQGFDRDVDVYLLHAGVSQAQLPHLIDAFLRQEAAFGPPPVETTVLLNRWEDDALYFLPPAVNVLRRAILWDETAWHAALFARIRQDLEAFVPAIEFERSFKKVFDQRLKQTRPTSSRGGSEALAPRPRLYWQSGELVLRLPRSEGRIRLWLDGAQQPLRLRGGEDWTMPQPWPHEIRWEIAGQTGQLELLAHGGCAAFDTITGHYLREIPRVSVDVELDSTDITILARTPFSVAGEPALEPEADSYVGFAVLRPRPVTLNRGGVQTGLKARPRRRLSLSGAEIANGPWGVLHGRSARLRIETGLGRSETRAVRISLGMQSRLIEVPISNDGFGDVGMEEVLADFAEAEAADPVRLRIELMAPSADSATVHPSGIELAAWVWPGFCGSDGIVFQTDGPVRNLVQDKCLHVGRDDQGRLCLEPSGGYSVARAVFEIEGVHVPFDLPWPDVTLTRRRAEGSLAPLPLGTRLSVGEDDRFDTISIRCPDQKAQLIIRGRCEERPFFGGLTRSLAVRDLLAPASDERVLLRRGNGSEVLLFELVAALAPQRINLLPTRHAIRLQLKFGEPVDAVAVEVEDETGTVVFAEAALRRRPVATRRPEWFHAEVTDNDALGLELTLDADWLDDGPRLARLLIRPEGRDGWRPLRNSRGDSFAVALANPAADNFVREAELQRRFEALSRWLSDCYAAQCWPTLERRLVPRWQELGHRLRTLNGGDGAVMRAACLPPPDHAAPGWVPILHPVQFAPDLYAAAPQTFASLAASIDPSVSEMAALATLNTARLRELYNLHPTVYLAFRNLQTARDMGARLEGFEPGSFFGNLPLVDSDPSAGWFWRGTPLLGPDHWRASHLRLVERLDAAGLFVEDAAEEGLNSRRQESLQRLMHAAWVLAPEELRPPAPHRSQESGEPAQVDLWGSALLSSFARASRLNEVTKYVDTLSTRAGMSPAQVLTSIAFMLRLAPELFAFHLLLWQIAKERP